MRLLKACLALVGLCAAAWGVVGCKAQADRLTLYQRLEHEDPSVRVAAIVEAGQNKDRKAVPFLVDRLGDSDSCVRFYAILALEKITGKTMGYRYYEVPQQRAAAEERWRQWLGTGGKDSPATQPQGTSGT